MKKTLFYIIISLIFAGSAFGQYKSYDKPVNTSTNNLILGIFNPKNFTMNQSLQVSMISSMYGNVSLTSYVNSMNYKFSDKFNVSADVKLQYSPYASSAFGKSYSSALQNSLSGVYLSRIALDYKISDNSYIKFEFRNLNDGSLYDGYGFYNPLLRGEFLR